MLPWDTEAFFMSSMKAKKAKRAKKIKDEFYLSAFFAFFTFRLS